MTEKDFWSKASVAVIGGGAFGTVLAQCASRNSAQVRVWVREEDRARQINSTRQNPDYFPDFQLTERVRAYSDLERVFEGGVQAVIWALPSSACRSQARALARYFRGDEVVIHATKGIEEGTLKRISEILAEELPIRRIGVLSGPNLAHEIAKGEPAATVIASAYDEVTDAGQELLSTDRFRVYSARDVIGVEWAGTLKNILAIASGALDSLKYGWNARSMLITRGLAEMVRFGMVMGADQSTFLGLAGVGDLLATCSSPLSRNYRVGFRLAQGEKLPAILKELGSTAEGVRTTESVARYAREHKIDMPLTYAVEKLLQNDAPIQEILKKLMSRPPKTDVGS
jgi:glycerol-3-phosphate dehydrogenase (NAD(P)+)